MLNPLHSTPTLCWRQEAIDLVEAFGPMAGMHAALERTGVGVPCGLVARFKRRTLAQVDAAVLEAARQFPVLSRRLVWEGGRPKLRPLSGALAQARVSAIPINFVSSPDGPLWRYELRRQGKDVWLIAVWAHAAADGLSMLHFLEATNAALSGRQATPRAQRIAAPVRSNPALLPWLPRFLLERQLRYTGLQAKGEPGVTWLTLSPCASLALLARAKEAGMGFASWLAAAACLAYVRQQAPTSRGRVCLDLPVCRNDFSGLGDFGFGAGSLLMPVNVGPAADVPGLAQRIARRLKAMKQSHWDHKLRALVGGEPRKHLQYAAFEAKSASKPRLTVSWKGQQSDLGAQNNLADIACFASSNAVHVSAHADRTGLSISIASPQSPAAREALLRAIAGLLTEQNYEGSVLSLTDLRRTALEPAPRATKSMLVDAAA